MGVAMVRYTMPAEIAASSSAALKTNRSKAKALLDRIWPVAVIGLAGAITIAWTCFLTYLLVRIAIHVL